ncbi:RelA/SpoT domain-containing protein [Fulvivirgaceae bacterium PWU5]|uniref:RelA/SpoT domain-containing protein n=1 Tax=Dawidia cretensis TaxID=2782350 RepID=A0AAP2GS86_9BACT|nr:RelA/SpoT domain-containing protein [Dawidia cretensis]MBT1711044.1 RelA/SpoT domain-containing protein [Dawidia cretensis]
MKNKILSDFDLNHRKFEDFRSKLEIILADLLQLNLIKVHQVTSRVKDRNSLESKIDLKDKYSDLHQITDLVGLRVITYLESDVDKVAEIIKNEFLIDSANSVDKRNLKSDQFGYRSLHYVMSLNELRSALPEYRQFASIKAEIQIRSTLQHVWVDIPDHVDPDRTNRRLNICVC